MSYKYSHKDWEEGKITWTDIESHKYQKDFISNECVCKIQKHQQKILDDESYRYTENLVKGYIFNRRKSSSRSTLVSGLLKTIDNLLNKDVDSFKDTIVLDEEQAMKEAVPKEYIVKVIPPLNWTNYDRSDIYWIQQAYSNFYTLGQWDIEVVETSNKKHLSKYVEFKGAVLAKAYIDFARRLRQYEGDILNTFKSDMSDYELGKMRVDLIKRGFISKNTNRKLFIKAFQGYYLFKNERIVWLKNIHTLRYFIIQLGTKLSYQKEYGKWQIVANCFVQYNSETIDPDTVRKANKIDEYPLEKTRLDNTLSTLI